MGTSRMVKSLSAAAMVVGWSLLTSSTVGAVQSDYLPPNPPAQAVAEGAFGYFSMSFSCALASAAFLGMNWAGVPSAEQASWARAGVAATPAARRDSLRRLRRFIEHSVRSWLGIERPVLRRKPVIVECPPRAVVRRIVALRPFPRSSVDTARNEADAPAQNQLSTLLLAGTPPA